MEKLHDRSQEYLNYLDTWLQNLPIQKFVELNTTPESMGVLVVDMVNGFCNEGPLASNRVKKIVNPIAALLRNAWDRGVRNVYLLNDTHEPDAVEFQNYPPHSIKGTEEAKTVEEIRSLKFYEQMRVIPKNSISSSVNTKFSEELNQHPELTHFIVVGNCTDLCVYQLAMFLRLDANARQDIKRRVVIPANCVNTYDLGVNPAVDIGAPPHPGDLFHAIFLHHMFLNGVEIYKELNF